MGGLVFETVLLFLLCPALVIAGVMCVNARSRKMTLTESKPKPARPLSIPSAEETAETVRKFRKAAARYLMLSHRGSD